MGNQMLLVLLAAVLFSTIVFNTYNHVFTQRELVYNGIYMLQGQKIADRYFQKIGCELINATVNSTTTYSSVLANYSTFSSADVLTIDGVTYYTMLTSNACDSLGNIGSPSAEFTLISLEINCCPNGSDTLYIGTIANPLSKIYADSGL